MNSGSCTVLATVALKSAGKLKPWQLRTAKRMVLDHLDTGISVTELATACGLSRSHFTRMFKESTQVPPQKWMREQRIKKSKELLAASSMVLAEIALDCGFYDQAHFCRTFMKTEGMTPLAWQQLNNRGAGSTKSQGWRIALLYPSAATGDPSARSSLFRFAQSYSASALVG